LGLVSTAFGSLLRRYRLAASLSQEALATAAGISVSAVGTYERGIHSAPHRQTVLLLADALNLVGTRRTEFEKAARPKIRDRRDQTAATTIDNLPAEATSFVGRDADVGRIQELLARQRCLTVTGTGGIGKTRVAIRAARALKRATGDGIAFVDLSSISDEQLVTAQIASATQIPVPNTLQSTEDFAKQLKDRELLLVVDNCEHLINMTGEVISAILKFAPAVTVLATSRERLRIGSETVYRLSSLAVPGLSAKSAVDVGRSEAVQLFVERAAAIDRHFALTEARAELVATICRKLDGVPLALELAAARVATLGLRNLRDQLSRAIAVLSNGNRDVPTRQRTLEATLAWSFGLLDEREQALFRRLSVFVGGWTLKGAQRVCADAALTPEIVLEALSSLVDKSLINVDLDPEEPRYDMLQVARSFALAEAKARDESEANARRHATWLAEISLDFMAQGRFLPEPRSEPFGVADIDNMRAAASWCLRTPQTALLAAAFISASTHLWWQRGFSGEYEQLSRTTLTCIDADKHPLEAGKLHRVIALCVVGDEKIAEAELAVRAFSIAGDRRRAADSAVTVAFGMNLAGRNAEASRLADFARQELLATGCEGSLAYAESLRTSGYIAAYRGDFIDARRLVGEATATFTSLRMEVFAMECLAGLVEFDFICGDATAALTGADRVIEIARRLRFQGSEMYMLCNRAGYNLSLRNIDDARDDARAALSFARDNDRVCTLTAVQHLATVAALNNMPHASARLIGFVDHENQTLARTVEIPEQICLEILVESLSHQLSSDRIRELKEDGGRLENAEVIELALSV
jgi:predicted ATPase/DNA-binding XRE family transcriptional regulator